MTEPRDPNEPGWGAVPGAGGDEPGAAPQPPPGWGAPPPQWGAPPPGYGPPPPGYGQPPPAGYGPPPGAYGAGAYTAPYGYYGEPPTDGKAIGALVASILSWVFCPLIPAIVGVILAGQSSRAIRESGGRLKGDGMNTAARIIGWINIAACLIVLAIFIGAIATIEDTSYEEFGGCRGVTVTAERLAC